MLRFRLSSYGNLRLEVLFVGVLFVVLFVLCVVSIDRSWWIGVVHGVVGIVLVAGAFVVAPSFGRYDVWGYVCLVVPIFLLLY